MEVDVKHRRSRLHRRYGRSASPDVLFSELEATFKRGREALRSGDVAEARASAIRVGELALKANRLGLAPAKYGVALRAQRALIDGVEGRRAA
jgi:hypothetical protein